MARSNPKRSIVLSADNRELQVGALGWILIQEIRPTQITVGFREVAEKRRKISEARGTGRTEVLGKPVPVVIGPGAHAFALDRHHWLRGLLEDGVAEARVLVVDNLSSLEEADFWRALELRGWCHPFGADGLRLGHEAIPMAIGQLVDDPFRSLASALRRRGGFAKDSALFSEFRWADFLRQRIDLKRVTHDFEGALDEALQVSRLVTPLALQARRRRVQLSAVAAPPGGRKTCGG